MNNSSTPNAHVGSNARSRAPSRSLLALEARGILELQAFLVAYPLMRLAPRGDGHPVLVLPGLGASDASTRPLRTYLKAQGYAAHGWEQGRNFGPRPGVEAGLQTHLTELAERYRRKVSLIGWSLGGIFAREIARAAPELVRQVITLGSPFAGDPRANNAWQLYERLSGRDAGDVSIREIMRRPPPVPSTAIYSRSDGIVAWQGCLEQESPTTQNIEVEGSHSGLGHNPVVVYVIADRLVQPDGEWRRFERNGVRGLFFPNPRRRRSDAAMGYGESPAASPS